ncbi:MAG TPA: hypothetical protein VE641_08810 [Chthoniobacterales bacterium]|nr:hypothetical protein [Chthoniobacterales bacterium]
MQSLPKAVNDEWERQIEEDLAAGRLNFLLEEVDDEIAAGRTKPFNVICGNL